MTSIPKKAFFCILAYFLAGQAESHEGHDHGDSPSSNTTLLLDTILGNDQLTIFTQAITNAGVESSFVLTSTPYTILAPRDAAWRSLSVDFLSSPRLGGILTFHVIPGHYMASSLFDGDVVKTLWGLELTVSKSGSNITFVGGQNNATVVQADISSGQSIVHIVDNVLDRRSNTATASAPQLSALNKINDTHTHPPNPLAPSPSTTQPVTTAG